MRWKLAGACVLALGMTTGCPEDFGKGGRIDRAARKDTEELLQERCSPSEYIDFCGGEKQHSKECRERCGG